MYSHTIDIAARASIEIRPTTMTVSEQTQTKTGVAAPKTMTSASMGSGYLSTSCASSVGGALGPMYHL
ncbi:Hypothetical protein D9617_14g077750 [Elsinoe fawcettii]|nr:Hypothetical protein D9617_14g077750 [Elsinoe fawcettii]